MPDAFYLPLETTDGAERFASTDATGGPWDPSLQHGGPPAALLGRAVERTTAPWPAVVTRISVDLLGPVPVTDVEVSTRVLRSGRSVELVEASLSAAGRVAARATAWRVRAADLELPPVEADEPPVPPLGEVDDPPPDWHGGYLRTMQFRVAAGSWSALGAATVWGRMGVPLVPGEDPTGLQRVLILADCGNGASNVLPINEWLFINPDLTVHLSRQPVGEWICLEAATTLSPDGFGLAASRLYDRDGLVGRGAQSLYVARRDA